MVLKMTRKLTSTNTGRTGTEPCARCGRTKRLVKLVHSSAGMVCAVCARVLAAAESRVCDQPNTDDYGAWFF